jgi:hypothetical protein
VTGPRPSLAANLAEAWTERASRAATIVMEQERTGSLLMRTFITEYKTAAGWSTYWTRQAKR